MSGGALAQTDFSITEWAHVLPGDMVMLHEETPAAWFPSRPTTSSSKGFGLVTHDDALIILALKFYTHQDVVLVTVQVVGRNIICMFCSPQGTAKLVNRPSE